MRVQRRTMIAELVVGNWAAGTLRVRRPVAAALVALLRRLEFALDPVIGRLHGIISVAFRAGEDRSGRGRLPVHRSTALWAFIGKQEGGALKINSGNPVPCL
jgi:hypothetical protein